MRRLEREVLDAERRERERLARDLHDGIGQELTGIALMLRVLAKRIGASSPECAGQVEQLVEAVNGLVQSSRTLTHGIFGAPVAGAGLEAALDGLARRASERSGIPVRFSALGARARRIEEGVAEQLYRIAQEATTNALRHSHASSIEIDLRIEDATLRLAVSDDGVGLPPEAAATGAGSGLRIMQFRAHAAGGELRIGPRRVGGQPPAAAPARPGTTVECSLVLPPVAGVH
jgi:signal transduction histidine kinase